MTSVFGSPSKYPELCLLDGGKAPIRNEPEECLQIRWLISYKALIPLNDNSYSKVIIIYICQQLGTISSSYCLTLFIALEEQQVYTAVIAIRSSTKLSPPAAPFVRSGDVYYCPLILSGQCSVI